MSCDEIFDLTAVVINLHVYFVSFPWDPFWTLSEREPRYTSDAAAVPQ